eukprot:CAMPEP_0201672858 /NCGR_PEP_ID=MMETSP0494-20130426/33226_1 /ASSEMBLY_ACC=CAM_ASM_000839 /TAXON_ID=420259 /ORGANISM="Thalassiosira gravida, Strain GMp14c1" /LENGTH=74 /DNA_ID=CAMNT_0048154601 /DNA_START=17 /DNA_END=242 /DNA_ORIENTATION=+
MPSRVANRVIPNSHGLSLSSHNQSNSFALAYPLSSQKASAADAPHSDSNLKHESNDRPCSIGLLYVCSVTRQVT